MMPPRFKHASTYAIDTRWCAARLREGYIVWCVRHHDSALVASYVATQDDLADWPGLEGEPRESFVVHRIALSPTTGNVMFGPLCPWPSKEVSP